MATRRALVSLVLLVAMLESLRSETITLTDDVCENTYLLSDTTYYLAWDGTHFGRDSFMNLLDGSITTKDSGSCKVSFEPVGTSSLNMCVTVEEFHIEDCNATVNYYHYGDSERKATYGCNVTPDSFCWNGKGVEVEIAYQGKSPQGSSNYFKLKITQYENFKVDWLTLIILAPFVGVAIIVAIMMVVVCRRKKSKVLVFWNSEIPHSRLVN